MRTSLLMRAVSASAAVTLFISLGLEGALAHSSPPSAAHVARPGIADGHGQVRGWRSGGRNFWAWRSQNRWSGLTRNRWSWNQGGFDGSGLWYSPYGFADTGSGVGGDVPVVVYGAPTFNVFPAATAESFDQRPEDGCVIHRLMYDHAGKYVGERQTPEC